MKPTEQRKAKRATSEKKVAKKQAKKKLTLKKKAGHEERKKEKAAKAKKRREDFESRLKANKRKPEDERVKVLSQGDGILPVSKKNRMSKEQKEEQNKNVINALAERGATARDKKMV